VQASNVPHAYVMIIGDDDDGDDHDLIVTIIGCDDDLNIMRKTDDAQR
jgi:hypothetical protein